MSNSTPITDVEVTLTGTDGNAFGILGLVSKEMRNAGVDRDTIDAYNAEAMSGDYDNLLRVTARYVQVS